MIWKVIGQSVIGLSHLQGNKLCEDAVAFNTITREDNGDVLVAFVSDGAGSAKYAKEASQKAVDTAVERANLLLTDGNGIGESELIEIAETVYDVLNDMAQKNEVSLNDYSCTLLGVIVFPDKACFIQIGDGAIVRLTGENHYSHIWWPSNGEYQNSTVFLIDDVNLRHLQTKVIYEAVDELAIFTDGLQSLVLINETLSVHQPFFNNLFAALRIAQNEEQVQSLNDRLRGYLSSDTINNRTDDDKTLLLATKLNKSENGIQK